MTNTYTQNYVDINGDAQTNTGTYLTPPDPSGTNGVVEFGDYADGPQFEGDKFVYDNPGNNHYLTQSYTATTGNWYALALMRVGTPSGDAPSLEHYNQTFVLADVPFDFEEGNTLYPAYLCIFQGNDTINEIKIKLPGNLDVEFETINMIDISATWSGGTANSWSFNHGQSGNPSPQHSYDVPQVYASASDGIVFNVPGPSTYTEARQIINNLQPISGGYIFTFDAVVTSSEPLSFRLLDDTGNGQHGVNVIDRTGSYRIELNMDSGVYNVEIDEGAGYVVQHQTQAAVPTNATNRLQFIDSLGFVGSVDNISLVNADPVYAGGSAVAFTFSGFNAFTNCLLYTSDAADDSLV